MDTEKKPDEEDDETKQCIGNTIGNLIASSTTLLAHSAEAVMDRFKKEKRASVKAVLEDQEESEEVGHSQEESKSFQESHTEEKCR
jgi:hypothetical protein